MTIILRLCKKIYDVDFHVENVELRDFVRYPSCPEFSKIEKKLIIFVTLIFAMI